MPGHACTILLGYTTTTVANSGSATEATLSSLLTELGQKLETGGTITTAPVSAQRSDTFTTTSSGVTVDVSSTPLSVFSIAVKGTGGVATIWTALLEGSLDGTNFTTILAHTNVTGDGLSLFIGASAAPSRYFRSRCSALTLGPASNIVVNICGVP